MKLNPFQMWMVRQNLEYAKAEGIDTVVNRLLSGGYTSVAAAVRAEWERVKA